MTADPLAEPNAHAHHETGRPARRRSAFFDLFLISFLILFFELACIRWFGSMVVFLTFFTNIVQLAPRERVGDYAVAQSSLMGIRGTIAPFAAAALLTAFSPQMVMIGAMGLMVAGLVVMARAVRSISAGSPSVLEAAPA